MVGGETAKLTVTVGTHAGKQGPHLQGGEADWPTAVSPLDHRSHGTAVSGRLKPKSLRSQGPFGFFRDRVSCSHAGLLLSV